MKRQAPTHRHNDCTSIAPQGVTPNVHPGQPGGRAATPPRPTNAPAKQARNPAMASLRAPRAIQIRTPSRVAATARRKLTDLQPRVTQPKSSSHHPPTRGAQLARNERFPRKTGEVQGREQTSNGAQRVPRAGQSPTTAAPSNTNKHNQPPAPRLDDSRPRRGEHPRIILITGRAGDAQVLPPGVIFATPRANSRSPLAQWLAPRG